MGSDEARRLSYLDAMGIQVWWRRPGEAVRPAASAGSLPTAPEAAASDADAASADWEPLRAQVMVCSRCGLHQQRTQAVFGVGDQRARWLVVGEAPGADEDRQGEPFVGRAGKLLTNMLLAIGLKREEVYIANIVKCRPPGNREPTPEEAAACAPFLARQIDLIRPRIILAVGRIAAQNLLKTDRTVGALRGRRFGYGDTGIPVVVTYHPAYLLRSPQEKLRAWQDLLFAKEIHSRL